MNFNTEDINKSMTTILNEIEEIHRQSGNVVTLVTEVAKKSNIPYMATLQSVTTAIAEMLKKIISNLDMTLNDIKVLDQDLEEHGNDTSGLNGV
jgi:archaellum component FlaC